MAETFDLDPFVNKLTNKSVTVKHNLSMVWFARYILENQIRIKQFAMSYRQLVFRRSQLDYCIFYQDTCSTYFRSSTLVISSIPISLKF